MKSLVNNLSVLAQSIYEENKKRLHGKPYEKYFNKDLFIHDDVVRSTQSGPLTKVFMQPPTIEGINVRGDIDIFVFKCDSNHLLHKGPTGMATDNVQLGKAVCYTVKPNWPVVIHVGARKRAGHENHGNVQLNTLPKYWIKLLVIWIHRISRQAGIHNNTL